MTTNSSNNSFQLKLPCEPALLGKIAASVLVLMLFASMVIYGVSVYYEQKVLSLGRKTLNLHEDNQGLQIQLDRLQSFENVATVSANLKGMQVAQDVVSVIPKNIIPYVPPAVPDAPLPKDAYGY